MSDGEETVASGKKGNGKKKLDWAASDAKQLMAQDMMDGLVPYLVEIKNKKKLYDDMYAGTTRV